MFTRKPFLLLIGFLAATYGYSQDSYLSRIRETPTVMSREAVAEYLSFLDSLRNEVIDKSEKYKNENEEATNNIDPEKTVQAYLNKTQNLTSDEIIELQKQQTELMEINQNLENLKVRLMTKKDSIDAAYKKDYETFLAEYSKYMNECSGVVPNINECNSQLAALNKLRVEILKKYFFGQGEGALYATYLNEYRTALPPLLYNIAVADFKSSETFTQGIVIPHKEDLIYCEIALDVIAEIENVFKIDPWLWPSE